MAYAPTGAKGESSSSSQSPSKMLFGLVTRAKENTCNQASHTWSDQQVLIGCDVRGNTFFSFLGFCFVYLFFYQITDRVLILYCSQM